MVNKRLISVDSVLMPLLNYMITNAYLNDTALDVLKLIAGWIDEAPEAMKWTPTGERLPREELKQAKKDGMDLYPCLGVYYHNLPPYRKSVICAWYDGRGFMNNDGVYVTEKITHWMPMPTLPEED